jgi:hypothetical protein
MHHQHQPGYDRKAQYKEPQELLIEAGMRDPAAEAAQRQAGKERRSRLDLPQRQFSVRGKQPAELPPTCFAALFEMASNPDSSKALQGRV